MDRTKPYGDRRPPVQLGRGRRLLRRCGGSHGRLRGCPGPLLSTPLLADTAAETVDARTVKFLLQKTSSRKNKEEEERRKEVAKQQEEKY